MELRSGVHCGKSNPPTSHLSSHYTMHLLPENGAPWQNTSLDSCKLDFFPACLNSCVLLVQGDSDIRRWCLRVLLLCLQLQGTQWSSTCIWTSGGRIGFIYFLSALQMHIKQLWFYSVDPQHPTEWVSCVFVSQHAAREEILANGGSLSHHHGGTKNLQELHKNESQYSHLHLEIMKMVCTGVQAPSRVANVLSDLSLLPSHVQNLLLQLRWMTLTLLFVHFSGDQMKREQGRAAKQTLWAPSGLTEMAALSILPSASLFSYITSGYSSDLSKTVCSESAAILNHNFSWRQGRVQN